MSVESIKALAETQRFPGWRPSTAVEGWLMRRRPDSGVWEHFPRPIGPFEAVVEEIASVGATPVRDAVPTRPAPSGDLLVRMTAGLPGRLFNNDGRRSGW